MSRLNPTNSYSGAHDAMYGLFGSDEQNERKFRPTTSNLNSRIGKRYLNNAISIKNHSVYKWLQLNTFRFTRRNFYLHVVSVLSPFVFAMWPLLTNHLESQNPMASMQPASFLISDTTKLKSEICDSKTLTDNISTCDNPVIENQPTESPKKAEKNPQEESDVASPFMEILISAGMEKYNHDNQ